VGEGGASHHIIAAYMSLPFSNLFICLTLTNVLNTNFSLTYKVLTTSQPRYLHNLVSLQPPCSTHFSSVVTLSRLPTISSLKITDRSFTYALPRLWNQLPDSFCQPHQSCLKSPPRPLVNPSLSSLLSASITPSLQAQNLPFQRIVPTLIEFWCPWTTITDRGTGPDFSCSSMYF